RTQELIFFNGGDSLNVVDMPGYGYAAAPKSKIVAWTELIDAFLRGRSNLARVYVLIDARHGLKTTDDAALDALGQSAVSHHVVSNKERGRDAADPRSRRGRAQPPRPQPPAPLPAAPPAIPGGGPGDPQFGPPPRPRGEEKKAVPFCCAPPQWAKPAPPMRPK